MHPHDDSPHVTEEAQHGEAGLGADPLSSGDVPRLGDVEKCPVCGSHVDADAYHCPSCRSYFCFHCRARVLPPDPELQCVNQDCGYYGKLVCGVCDVAHEKEDPPVVYAEPEDGYWPAVLAGSVLVAAICWYFTSFLFALVVAVVAFAGVGYWLHHSGVNVFGVERRIEHHRKSLFYTCVRCGEPAKRIQTNETGRFER